MTRILVTGASGITGRPLLARLQSADVTVRTAARHPVEGADEHVPFDWMKPQTHAAALEGVDRMYLLGPGLAVDYADIVLPFVRNAIGAGVRRFVMLSASAVAKGEGGLGAVHAALEDDAPEWTVLRPSWFMQNLADPRHHLAHGLKRGQLVTATGTGRVAFVDAEDIASVAARALLDTRSHDAAHVLTGPTAHAYDEVATVAAEVIGRPVAHQSVSLAELVRHLVHHDMPRPYAQLLASLDGDVAAGRHAATTDTVERVTGAPATTLQVALRRILSGSASN